MLAFSFLIKIGYDEMGGIHWKFTADGCYSCGVPLLNAACGIEANFMNHGIKFYSRYKKLGLTC